MVKGSNPFRSIIVEFFLRIRYAQNHNLKITNADIKSIEKNPIELFYDGIKSPATKERYTRILRSVLCTVFEDILTGTFEERSAQFVKKAKADPDWAMSVMLSLANKLKERTKLPKENPNYYNPSSFGNHFKPLKKLLDMNGVPVVWKRIYATFPEHDNTNVGRGYTRLEIQKMLDYANGPIDRAIILVASSSGIREGGFSLRWEDVMPVYNVDDKILLEITESQQGKIICAILKVYQGTSDYYPAFITPEAYQALLDWKTAWMMEVKREPKPKDPIFKKEGNLPIMLKPTAIKARVENVLQKSGLRKPLARGKRRHEIPSMNGFRRFFNKTNKETLSRDSPLSALIKKEYMMAHSGLVKLDRNYFQTHVLELVEEYLNAVPHLTISDELRLKEQNILKDAKIKQNESEKDKELRNIKTRLAEQEKLTQAALVAYSLTMGSKEGQLLSSNFKKMSKKELSQMIQRVKTKLGIN